MRCPACLSEYSSDAHRCAQNIRRTGCRHGPPLQTCFWLRLPRGNWEPKVGTSTSNGLTWGGQEGPEKARSKPPSGACEREEALEAMVGLGVGVLTAALIELAPHPATQGAGRQVLGTLLGTQGHVRHRPPWETRPWVVEEEGRRRQIGQILFWARCADEERD
ncbi:MAG: DUF3565 domain-containing protein [Terriglobales bacterium]